VTSAENVGGDGKGAAAGSGDAPRLDVDAGEGAPLGKQPVWDASPGKLAVAEGSPPGKRVATGAGGSESKTDFPVVPASPTGASEEEGTHSDGSPEGSTGSGWFVVGSG
jgi:hypothetical protein